MCVALPIIFAAATVASTAIAAISSIQAGNAQSAASNYQAQISQQNAQFAQDDKVTVSEQAAMDRRRRGIEAQAQQGEIRARAASMGLDSEFGSFDDLQKDVAQAYSVDRGVINENEITNLKNLDRQQAGFIDQAQLDTSTGKAAKQAGYLGAAGDILQGAAQLSSKWMQPGTPKPPTPTASKLPQLAYS